MPDATQFDRLDDENYHDWKTYMEAILIKKGLWAVVDGSERHPGGTEGTKKVRDYRTKQAQARAEITLHVTPSQLAHCAHPDPMIIWNTLASVHAPRGRSTIISLRRRLHKLRFDRTTETMSGYIARARHIVQLLHEAGHIVPDDDLLLSITSGLPHSYDPFLISLDTLPDSEYALESIIPRLINEYTRQAFTPTTRTQAKSPSQGDEAYAVTPRRPISEITCYNCNRKGHYQVNCPLPKQNPDQSTADGAHIVAEYDDDDVSF